MSEPIFVGPKPAINYSTSIVTQFTLKNSEKVEVKARGRFVGRAIDASLVAEEMLDGTAKVTKTEIKNSYYEKDGEKSRVSEIKIVLEREDDTLQ